MLQRGAYSGIQLANVLQGVRLDRLFSRSLPKPTVSDPYLQRIVGEHWRPNAAVASGSTADALRFERATGILLSKAGHTQKAQDTIRGLQDWLRRSPNAIASDQKAAQGIIDDLLDALK
jgi:filamentous hemagglutinin